VGRLESAIRQKNRERRPILALFVTGMSHYKALTDLDKSVKFQPSGERGQAAVIGLSVVLLDPRSRWIEEVPGGDRGGRFADSSRGGVQIAITLIMCTWRVIRELRIHLRFGRWPDHVHGISSTSSSSAVSGDLFRGYIFPEAGTSRNVDP
jgi:hypothetical protein